MLKDFLEPPTREEMEENSRQDVLNLLDRDSHWDTIMATKASIMAQSKGLTRMCFDSGGKVGLFTCGPLGYASIDFFEWVYVNNGGMADYHLIITMNKTVASNNLQLFKHLYENYRSSSKGMGGSYISFYRRSEFFEYLVVNKEANQGTIRKVAEHLLQARGFSDYCSFSDYCIVPMIHSDIDSVIKTARRELRRTR